MLESRVVLQDEVLLGEICKQLVKCSLHQDVCVAIQCHYQKSHQSEVLMTLGCSSCVVLWC